MSVGRKHHKNNKLRWLEHVMRREKSEAERTIMEMNVEGIRGRGRLKKKWLMRLKITGVYVK